MPAAARGSNWRSPRPCRAATRPGCSSGSPSTRGARSPGSAPATLSAGITSREPSRSVVARRPCSCSTTRPRCPAWPASRWGATRSGGCGSSRSPSGNGSSPRNAARPAWLPSSPRSVTAGWLANRPANRLVASPASPAPVLSDEPAGRGGTYRCRPRRPIPGALVDVQVDSQQCQPPQEDGKNDRQYGLEQPQMQVTPRPCDEYADGEVEQEDNANWSFKHGCAAPIRP